MTERFYIDPAAVLRKWTEQCEGDTWYYVEHIRDGNAVVSYSNYADPLDSQSNPFFNASSCDTTLNSPFTRNAAPE